MRSKLLLALLFAGGFLFLAFAALLVDVFAGVPDFTQLRSQVRVPIKLANGEKGFKWMGPTSPGWIPLSQISSHLPRAVVSSEDTSFYAHDGIDMHEIQAAIKKDWEEKRFARGASTLTQQVIKNVYLSQHKTLWRKLKEIFWARRVEKVLSKGEILTFYLNMAEWGKGIYGVKDAVAYYFGSTPASLTPRQAAFLAMLLPSPRRYQSYFHAKALTHWASSRVDRILTIMHKMGHLDSNQYEVALNERLWGSEPIADDAPGAPQDPGFVTEGEEDDFTEVSRVRGRGSTRRENITARPNTESTPNPPGSFEVPVQEPIEPSP